MIRISQLKLKVTHNDKNMNEAVCRALRIKPEMLCGIRIVKRSLDARKKPDIFYSYVVDVKVKDEDKVLHINRSNKDVSRSNDKVYEFPVDLDKASVFIKDKAKRPVIIGTGPAGLFCAYMLAEYGFRPIVFERGEAVEKRMASVQRFWEGSTLKKDSNVQFGEGGAGTFSDGKLNTLVKDVSGRNKKVLELFVEAGAPEDILYVNKPHIGTDILCEVVKNMRNHIIECGGEIFFESKVTECRIAGDKIDTIIVETTNDIMPEQAEIIMKTDEVTSYELPVDEVVLAIGHSARDTFKMLYDKGISMEAKSFAMGVRIQHPQEMINISQYGDDYPDCLPAADYKLTYQAANGRSVYSFCMCPGGYVVNASSEEGRLAINGMSYRDRGSLNANSALIVSVNPEDYGSDSPLAGVEFQRRLEEKAYAAAEGKIPTERLGDFMEAVRADAAEKNVAEVMKAAEAELEEVPTEEETIPQFRGIYEENVRIKDTLPEYMCEALAEGIRYFGTRIKGFDRNDAILSAVESRTSSPIRINRSESFESNIAGLYPCGEGAGYAGGITSAAMDGIKVAEAIAKKICS